MVAKMTLEEMDELLKDSKLTEADAERIGHKLKKEIRKRFDLRLKMVEKKIKAEQQNMKKKGVKYLSEKQALKKYR